MPLRAKILPMATPRSFASPANTIRELPSDEPNDVLFGSQYGVRTITLNRPKKLNSLNGSMARKIVPRLQEWSKSQMANVVVIKGEGRAFCAGGDVAYLALRNKEGKAGQQESKDYFALEYQLDHLIATYGKPYVAFLDGITMGGGVGLSLHAPFRIATENTVFAMPETTIGFFPDVGASFFLPRLDGSLGKYLALTSAQLKGVDVFWGGIATHYLHSSSLPDLEARLAELQFPDSADLNHRYSLINSTIEEFTTGLPSDQAPKTPPVHSGDVRAAIDYVFQPANAIHEVLDALQGTAENRGGTASQEVMDWATTTRSTILSRSPTSVKVTMRQFREGLTWSIAETFRKEHQIASRFMEHADFIEGVSALLIDKPKRTPSWSPPTLDEVPDHVVDSFFSNEPSDLQLLNAGSSADYTSYPHAWIGLPTEDEILAFVGKANAQQGTLQGVVDHFESVRNGKLGVKEKVQEVLTRRTYEGDNGRLSVSR